MTPSYTLEWDRFRLELGPRQACIMGVLNTTPDSFSDGGLFHSLEDAVAQGRKLWDAGAHILDIGGESSRPFSQPVSIQEEMDRVVPVIEALAPEIDIPISVDTVKAPVAEAALAAGAAMINDISAFEKDPELADVTAKAGVPCILMHMKGTPETMQVNPDYNDLMTEITGYLSERAGFAVDKGIPREKIILDPGIGFGKTVAHNLILIKEIGRLNDLGFPVLMGPSRKSFIQKTLTGTVNKETGPLDPLTEIGTLGAVAACLFNGAHIVRVHDVESAAAFTRIIDAVRNA